MRSTFLAIAMLTAHLAAIAFAHADTSECSAATERDAIAAYDPPRMGDYSDMFGGKRVAFISGYCAHAASALARRKRDDLYAFCDATWATQCNERALMLKDVCEATLKEWTDGSPRFWCYRVDGATRDAYLRTVEPRVREKTFEAWREGR